MNPEATPYDRVEYPTAVFAQTHPERLAVLARMAGLDPAPPATARVLEIGGGNCMNVIAFAAAYPGADVHGFDLSSVAIARGQEVIDAAGLGNVTLVVEDILAATARYPAGSFDYVIAHGVYAWVPDHVRAATMALIGHVLSDRGVAFVSYNALPGGHIRQIMRDMLFEVVRDIADPDTKIATARAFLETYAKIQPTDEPLNVALRKHAEAMIERPAAVLFHDELGDCFYPQYFRDVVSAGQQVGLSHLTDAGRNRHLDGFLSDSEEMTEDAEMRVARSVQLDDFLTTRFFRQTTFVRAGRPLDRAIDPMRIADLYLSTKMKRAESGEFIDGEDRIEIPDEELAAALAAASAQSPQRVPLTQIARTSDQLRVILQLFTEWYVNLHIGPAPFAPAPGDRPETGPLVRAMLAEGSNMVCTLDQSLLKIDQPELRALLLAADGTRSMAELAALDHGIPGDQVPAALAMSAKRGLLAA